MPGRSLPGRRREEASAPGRRPRPASSGRCPAGRPARPRPPGSRTASSARGSPPPTSEVAFRHLEDRQADRPPGPDDLIAVVVDPGDVPPAADVLVEQLQLDDVVLPVVADLAHEQARDRDLDHTLD